jgi:hypothetical protein
VPPKRVRRPRHDRRTTTRIRVSRMRQPRGADALTSRGVMRTAVAVTMAGAWARSGTGSTFRGRGKVLVSGCDPLAGAVLCA